MSLTKGSVSLVKLFGVVAAVALPLSIVAWVVAVKVFGFDAVLFWHLIRR